MSSIRQRIFEKVVDFVVKKDWINLFNELCSTFPSFVNTYIDRVEREVSCIELNYTKEQEQEMWEDMCRRIQNYEEGLRK